ncbi:hypothetical protein PSKAS_29640 [Peribacillus sp. N1]
MGLNKMMLSPRNLNILVYSFGHDDRTEARLLCRSGKNISEIYIPSIIGTINFMLKI